MTSRERITAALNHQEPDKVPVDLGGAVVTGIHALALDKLRKALGLEKRPVKVYEPMMMLGMVEGDVIESVGGDVVGLNAPVVSECRITMYVKSSKAAEFALKLRIPYWSKETSLELNGRPVPEVEPGRYATLDRKWGPDDRIDLDLDLSLHFWVGERECEGLTSVYRGPILLAYDHRYNLEHARRKRQVRDPAGWDPTDCMMHVPSLDARTMKPGRVQWSDWLPPLLLLEFEAAEGRTVRLCDFGSAGEAGTPYLSWLPIKHCPPRTDFSRINPLRTSRRGDAVTR